MKTQFQDHLFISYAVEDQALARWLTLKLTATGYKVWCDQFKLLGGESYPKDIDHALKEQTFRMLALLSRFSIAKPNPTKERTLALNIARDRGCEFIVPLNVDGLKPTELDWMTSDLTFIPFSKSWAAGFSQLLLKLKSISAPQSLINEGKQVAAETFLTTNVLRQQPEILHTNWLKIGKIPETIYGHKFSQKLAWDQWNGDSKLKSAYRIDPSTFLTFSPTMKLNRGESENIGGWRWADCEDILGIKSKNLVSSLLRKSIYSDLARKGLKYADEGRTLFFPRDLLPQDKLHYVGPLGKKNWIQVVGNRTFRRGPNMREVCSYHLAPKFTIRQDLFEPYVVEMRIALHLLTNQGLALRPRAAHSRRRKITKFWHNSDWLNRYFAVLSFIGQGSSTWRIGAAEDELIEISTSSATLKSPTGIDEELLEKRQQDEPIPDTVEIQVEEDEDDDE